MKHFKTLLTDLETLQFLGHNTMGALTYGPELAKDLCVQYELKEWYEDILRYKKFED